MHYFSLFLSNQEIIFIITTIIHKENYGAGEKNKVSSQQ